MQLGKKNEKYHCISLIFLVVTVLLNNIVSGDILDPPLEAMEDNDVELISVVSGNTLIVIETNIPNPVDGPTIRLAKILHDGGADDPITFESNPPPMVSIERDGVDAYLVLNSPLDYETVPEYNNFAIMQGLTPIMPLILTVKDINDNPPVFDSDTCTSKEVLENEESGFLLCTFQATDRDTIDRDALRYSFEESLPGGKELFSLDNENGAFALIGSLDYIASPMYRFQVFVKDSDEIHAVSTIFTINIKDVPNLPPVLNKFQPFVTVPEGSTIGHIIQTIEATDGDIQVKCPLEYTIDFGNPDLSRFFDLDKDSGILTVKEEIDATEIFNINTGLVINAVVTVTEKNDRTVWPDAEKYPDLELKSDLQINIADSNTHSPEFCFSDLDCDSPNEISIVTDENVFGSLPLATGIIFVRDLDPTQQYSTFDVTLEESSEAERYVVQALSIIPASGFFGTSFSISTISSNALDYEDNTGFDGTNEGKWWRRNSGVPEPKPVRFIIKATDKDDPTKFARKEVTLTVRDKNDNPPVHPLPVGQEYTFAVCEDVRHDTVLKRKNYDPDNPICTEEDFEEVYFDAEDSDISDSFGTPSIEYLWFSKAPPLELDKDTGKMTVKWPEGSIGVFDFERYQEEIFTVEAIDEKSPPGATTRQRSTAVVKFVILDVNDTPVDLRLSSSRIEIEENTTTVAFPVTIVATDEDLQGCVEFDLRITSSTGNNELDAQIARWFKIVALDGEETTPCKRERSARIELGDSAVDREGYDSGLEVDRVDVSIIARDTNTKTGDSERSARLTIEIKDKNDNPPEFQDYDENDEIRFIENFGTNFGEDGDSATPNEREIAVFRATDRDRNTEFVFLVTSPHELMEGLVELEVFPNGRAILRRQQGVIIDREMENFYGAGATDILHYILTVSDSVNQNQINVYIKIDDLNDNSPEFQNTEQEFTITEGTAEPRIEIFRAIDSDGPDRFGNVSYFVLRATDSDPEPEPFSIGIQSGIFSVDATAQWHVNSEYKIKVEAVDYYRPSSSSSSNRVNYDITVKVIDINDHDPTFISSQNGIWNEIKETEFNEGDRRFENFIEIEDLDDISLGNGDFSVRITAVVCVPVREGVDPSSFFDPELEIQDTSVKPSTKNVFLKATKSFENHWGIYTIHFEAEDKPTSGTPRKTQGAYQIHVESENLHSPKFGYPIDNSTKLYISYIAPVGPIDDYYGDRLSPITVTDDDDHSTGNGQIVSVALDATSLIYFNLLPRAGEVYTYDLVKRTVAFPETSWLHTVVITATDGGTPPNSVEAHFTIQVVPHFNSPPEFKDEDKPFNKEIMENDPDWEVDIPVAEDLDLIVGITPDVIYYHLAGGAVDYFFLITRIVDGVNVSRLSLKGPLDYEEMDSHKLVILASNDPAPPETPVDPENVDPNNKSYLLVGITVLDQDEDNVNVHLPKFCFNETDCNSPFEYSIVTDENAVGILRLETGFIFVKDLDTTQRFSTFDVTLEAESPEQKYVVDALSISPTYGYFGTYFFITTISSNALDYEDKGGFEENDNDGKWWKKNDAGVPEPKSVKFFIKATDRENGRFSRKEVTMTVRDKNDNAPVHQLAGKEEYTFAVCEDVTNSTVLKRKKYDPNNPVCTEEDGEEELFIALDTDISDIFGTPSIEYLWFSKPPPIELDKDTGKMTVKWPEGSNGVFDFERYREETFVVDAIDEKLTPESGTRQKSTAVVTFVILDVNDTPVDLRLSANSIAVEENATDAVFAVAIDALDDDLQGCVEFALQVDSTTGNQDLDAKIARWFKIVPIDGEETAPCKRQRRARIELGDLEVDREGYDSGLEVDRVDVSVIARDTNTKTGNSERSVRLTIEISDKNDNAPQFLTNQRPTWNAIKETDVVPDKRFQNPIVIGDLDDLTSGNGDFNVVITGAECDVPREDVDPLSFFDQALVLEIISSKPSRKNVWLSPAKSFAGHFGNYTVHFQAKDKPVGGEARITTGSYTISIEKDYFYSGSAKNLQIVGVTQLILLFIVILIVN